jgi:galactonate dehydratase
MIPADMYPRRSFLQLPALAAAVQRCTSAYARPKLKITGIKTAAIMAHGFQVHVRVTTDQGLTGQGEATDSARGAIPILQSWERTLMGQDPLNVEAIWERIRTSGIFAGAQAGQYVTALTGLEIALWDLAGKAVGLPVYQLLGGKVRDRIRVYCDSQTEDPKDPQAPQKLAMIKNMGFTAVKIDIDERDDPARWDKVNWTASNGEIDNMIGKIRFVRESFPKNVDLAVDMHGRYDMTTGKRVAIEAEPFKLLFLEEPVPAENVDAMRDIRQSTKTPICCGEARGGHHHAGHSEMWWSAGSPQDRGYGAYLLRAGGAALRGVADRDDGFGARLRGDSEFPGARMALDPAAGCLEEFRQGRRDH